MIQTILYWLLYYAFHSLFAADGVKAFMQQKLPAVYRRYRLWYSVVAAAGLGAILFSTFRHPGEQLFSPQYWGLGLLVLGVWLTLAAFRNYDFREFFGLNDAPAARHAELQTTGLNAWVRHPLYSGALCIFPGVALCFPYETFWAAVFALLVYLPFGIYWEEQKLLRQFGDAYADYRKRVRAVIPGLL
ncbi:MAG: isoprenylcysteine carboxylmethyltransferase family protein [Saprospiraceae bacterium]|nr:isoprenylcysteine carboxylmethyltransferase family protein [Saprospiraceae bacterium]